LLAGPDAANTTLDSQNGTKVIESSIRELFIRHGMCNQFGVTLLHRHFDLDQSERLVEVGKTSTPWGPSAYENTYLGKVIPQAFIFSAPGQLVPFEYTFFTHEAMNSGTIIDISSATKAFVDDLETLLLLFQLEKVLGLRTRPETSAKYEVEFTVDRANIFIELENPTPNSVVTSWYFCEHHANSTGDPRTSPRCVKRCATEFYCDTGSQGSVGLHRTGRRHAKAHSMEM
jgi:hypothetical protein